MNNDIITKSEEKAEAARQRVADLHDALERLSNERVTRAAEFDPTAKTAEKTATSVVALDWSIERTRQMLPPAEKVLRRAEEAVVPRVPVLAEAIAYALGDRWLKTPAVAVIGSAPAKPAEVAKPEVYIVQTSRHKVLPSGAVAGTVEIVAYVPDFMQYGPGRGREISLEIGRAMSGVSTTSGFNQMTATVSDGVIRLRLNVVAAFPEKPILSSVRPGLVDRGDLRRAYGLPGDNGVVSIKGIERDGDTTKAHVVITHSEPIGNQGISNALIAGRQRQAEARGAGLVGRVVPQGGRVVTFDRVEVASEPDGRPFVTLAYHLTAESVAA